MNIIKRRSRTIAVTLAVLAALGLATSSHACSVYRKVGADDKTRVMWTAENFPVKGSSLSFYYFPDDAAARAGMPSSQCFVKIDLGQPPGKRFPVGKAAIPIVTPLPRNPFPWEIVFDTDSHWIIPRSAITTSGSDVASTVAAVGLKSLATKRGSHVTVVNGNKPGGRCVP